MVYGGYNGGYGYGGYGSNTTTFVQVKGGELAKLLPQKVRVTYAGPSGFSVTEDTEGIDGKAWEDFAKKCATDPQKTHKLCTAVAWKTVGADRSTTTSAAGMGVKEGDDFLTGRVTKQRSNTGTTFTVTFDAPSVTVAYVNANVGDKGEFVSQTAVDQTGRTLAKGQDAKFGVTALVSDLAKNEPEENA